MRTRFSIAIVLLVLLARPLLLQAKVREVFLDRELETAGYVGEVVVVGYEVLDSILEQHQASLVAGMRCQTTDGTDTVLTFIPDARYTARLLYADEDTAGIYDEGYWPRVNDTVLVVINNSGVISLFAEISEEGYVFWSPYLTSSWITIFYFNAPAQPVATKGLVDDISALAEDGHAVEGYAFTSAFHCLLPKEELVNFLRFEHRIY